VDLYSQSPIRLHGIVLNYLSTGTNLPAGIEIVFIESGLGITHGIDIAT
jgi:hypothetical protein